MTSSLVSMYGAGIRIPEKTAGWPVSMSSITSSSGTAVGNLGVVAQESVLQVREDGLGLEPLGVGRPRWPPLLLEPIRRRDKMSFPSLVTSMGVNPLGGAMMERG